jgi:hypothetical protein
MEQGFVPQTSSALLSGMLQHMKSWEPIQLTSPAPVQLWEDTVIVVTWANQVSIWEIETGTLVVNYEIPVHVELSWDVVLQGTYLVVLAPEQTTSIICATTGNDITKDIYTGGS